MTADTSPVPRILVAEDDASHQHIVDVLLRRAGHTATIVPNGQAAIEAYSKDSFDVVLIDLAMPGMDGFETLKQLKAIQGDRRTCFIALTVYLPQTMEERCLKAGFDFFLNKPMHGPALQAALDRFQFSVST